VSLVLDGDREGTGYVKNFGKFSFFEPSGILPGSGMVHARLIDP